MANYENYAKVKARIEERRLKAIARADARNFEVREKSPVIAAIDRELEGTGLKIFSAACRGEDITPLKNRNVALLAERKQELIRLGLPEDYTEVQYFCKKCSDTGFIDGVKTCSCLKEELLTENIKSSGIGTLIESQSFDNFKPDIYRDSPEFFENARQNLEKARDYAKKFDKNGLNLFMFGQTGTGKTHISTAIAKEAITRGFDVVYDSAQNIISDFETDHFRSGYGSAEPKSTKYLECDLLIIDDLGAEFSTQFSLSCLYNLLNTRLNKRLATVISTNLGLHEIRATYNDRIYSRMFTQNTTVLCFKGIDQRIL